MNAHWAKRWYWSLREVTWLWIGRPIRRSRKLLAALGFRTFLMWPAFCRRSSGITEVRVSELPSLVHLRNGTSDFTAFREVFLDEEYEQDIPAEVRTVVDCGANVGMASLYFLRRYPGCRVAAVEPDPANLEIARLNLQPLGATNIPAAVWPEPAEVSLQRGTFRDGRDWATQVFAADGETMVQAVTIKQVMEQCNFESIDILKIDIEGAEGPLFSGDVSYLDATRCVMIELHEDAAPGCTTKILATLREHGFSITSKGMTTFALR